MPLLFPKPYDIERDSSRRYCALPIVRDLPVTTMDPGGRLEGCPLFGL